MSSVGGLAVDGGSPITNTFRGFSKALKCHPLRPIYSLSGGEVGGSQSWQLFCFCVYMCVWCANVYVCTSVCESMCAPAHMCVCLCAHMHAHIYTQACVPMGARVKIFLNCSLPSIMWLGSLLYPELTSSAPLTSQLASGIPCVHFPSAEIVDGPLRTHTVYVGARDVNSGSHACSHMH